MSAVTGGGSGIGYAIAERLVAEGAQVAILDIKGAAAAADRIGSKVVPYEGDVSDAGAMESTLRSVVDRFGGLHVMINNAGIEGALVPLAEYPVEEFDRLVEVNFRGVFLGMRFAIPHLIESGGGSIVNISSTAAIRYLPDITPYAATKAAVSG